MRVVPFGPALVFVVVGSTLLPMAPLLFLAYSLDDLLAMTVGLTLGR
jgi:hypothetical protein